MPYIFPYENVFVVAVSVLIVGLLLVRIGLIRHRRRSVERTAGSDRSDP